MATFWDYFTVLAACFSPPLDLLKVHLQTHQDKKRFTLTMAIRNVIAKRGLISLWNGLSAFFLKQIAFSVTWFGIYESKKHIYYPDTFYADIFIATVASAAGGFVGAPADLVKIRMQHDMKFSLYSHEGRNYRNAINSLIRVRRDEGLKGLFNGATIAAMRAGVTTAGYLSVYDQVRMALIYSGFNENNINVYIMSVIIAQTIATTITHPLDVLKTRMMNAEAKKYKSIWGAILHTAKLGPSGFFRGYVPASLRIVPNTMLMFMLFEYFRIKPEKQ